MNGFQCSPDDLRARSDQAGAVEAAIARHPINDLHGGDLGHAGVATALATFRAAWAEEFRLRRKSALGARDMLRGAASDTERVDALLAQAAAGLGGR